MAERCEIRLLLGRQLAGILGGDGKWHVEVNPRAVLGIEGTYGRRDLGAPVASLGAIAPIAQPRHQLDEGTRSASGIPAACAGRFRESVTGKGRGDDVELVGQQ